MYNFSFLLLGCQDVEKEDSGDQQTSEPVSVSLRLLDAMGGEFPEGCIGAVTAEVEARRGVPAALHAQIGQRDLDDAAQGERRRQHLLVLLARHGRRPCA